MFQEQFDLYLFDLDDTLINTSQAYTKAQADALAIYFPQLKANPADWQKHRNELQWFCKAFGSGHQENYFTAFLQNKKLDFDSDLVHRLVDKYNEFFWNSLKAIEHATEYLESLQNSGKKVGIVSNGKVENQLKKLQVTKLDSYFSIDRIWVSENYTSSQKKPSPHMINLAVRHFGVTPDKAVYFGNITSDILAGNAAGIKTVLFTDFIQTHQSIPGLATPDYTLEHWNQIPKLQ